MTKIDYRTALPFLLTALLVLVLVLLFVGCSSAEKPTTKGSLYEEGFEGDGEQDEDDGPIFEEGFEEDDSDTDGVARQQRG